MEPNPSNRWLSPDTILMLIALAANSCTGVWWAATFASETKSSFVADQIRQDGIEHRVTTLEAQVQQASAAQNQLNERMGRMEEKLSDELETTRRIETIVEGMYRRTK